MLTAVFSMCRVRGFDEQTLLTSKSDDPEIHLEAVHAAGNLELDAAWLTLSNSSKTLTPQSRPAEATEILADPAGSDDEEIVEAEEATAQAEIA